MDLRSIYIANGVGIFILLLLLYTSRTRILKRRAEDQIYTVMLFGVMVGCFMEALSYAIDGQIFAGSRIINYVANTYLYTANMLLPFCVLAYIDLGLYGDTSRIWKRYKPQMAVAAIMIILNIVNFFVPIVYWVSEQNVYERRPLSYVYFAVILYYCVSAIVVSRRYEKENGASTFFRVEVFLAPILLGTALQFMFYGLSLAWMTSAVGLCGLFMMQQNEMAYIDSLTDAYNRRYLNYIMSTWIDKGINFAGIMLDVDRFKVINDTYGHSEGDNALRDVADILEKSRKDAEWVFRFAGDEFIVLKRGDSADVLNPFIDEVNKHVEDYNRSGGLYKLSLSYGVSFFEADKTKTIDAFMKEIDNRMYEMKAQHHKEL